MVGTAGAIIITIVVLAVVGGVGWVFYSRLQAKKLGLPPPSLTSFIPFVHKSDQSPYGPPAPAPGGVSGWFNDQIRKFKNRNNRSAAGAYEGAGAAPGRRGFGPLDPDEAWDSRVGNEADHYGPGGYYEEQELGLHQPGRPSHHDENTAYHGASDHESYSMNLAATPQMASRGFDGDRGRTLSRDGRNPFDDDAAEPSNISLRGVSPRPMDGERREDNASERRSIFRENV
ncbi:hypothetical protein UCDDA912_g08646 [Diaporthe ampelina]|uniref:Acid phosphatase-like protein n=1 Tax=Diaporthe ampelina TaxID=1214573 RepID=A0A0G2F9P0_9PEZI|nr:hypothetical protein UCDDA912_g08646 [Diaporthe ampelina]